MKKALSIIIICTLVLSMFAVGGWAGSLQNTSEPRITLPYYHKLDPEIVRESRENGEKVTGKEFKGDHSKAYMKPSDGEAIEHLDVRTKEARSIAILVDFPVPQRDEEGNILYDENGDMLIVENDQEGLISEVPGVNYKRVPAQKFDDLLNGTEYNPFELDVFSWLAKYNGEKAPTDRTLRNYYNEVSYDQYQIQADVVDWVTLSQPYEYYLGQDKGYYNVNGDTHMGELVLEAVKLADETVDFSEYAVNGEVPGIFIIHRGTGAEYSRDPEIIWSHKWNILSASYFGYLDRTGQYMTDEMLEEQIASQMVDEVLVDTYNIVPEVGRDITGFYYGTPEKPMPAYAGVISHEFGHVLGLPDQYDYGYESEGTGMFTLMAGGSYGTNLYNADDSSRQYRWYSGHSPVHMNAWDKFYLGFADPIEVTENESITLKPVTEEPDIYKIEVPGSDGREYFLLENRQQESFDGGLAYNADGKDLHGLVVYHIVDDMIQKRFNRPNEAENWDVNHLGKSQQSLSGYGQTHYGFSVIQADGMFDLEHGNNDADAGDVFPGKYNVTSLSAKSNNSANTTSIFKWDTKSTETGISLENIVEHEDGTVTLDVVFTK